MADFTERFAQVAADHRLAQQINELHRLREEKRHWECESRQHRQQIDELCAEVGRLQRENQRLQDDHLAWEEWKEAMTTAAAKRLGRGQQ